MTMNTTSKELTFYKKIEKDIRRAGEKARNTTKKLTTENLLLWELNFILLEAIDWKEVVGKDSRARDLLKNLLELNNKKEK